MRVNAIYAVVTMKVRGLHENGTMLARRQNEDSMLIAQIRICGTDSYLCYQRPLSQALLDKTFHRISRILSPRIELLFGDGEI